MIGYANTEKFVRSKAMVTESLKRPLTAHASTKKILPQMRRRPTYPGINAKFIKSTDLITYHITIVNHRTISSGLNTRSFPRAPFDFGFNTKTFVFIIDLQRFCQFFVRT